MCFLQRRNDEFASAPRPDLILLDLNMPRLNGREFLAAIKADELLAAIPVVVLTTSDAEKDVLASYQLGAASFISKPLDMEEFIAVIRQLDRYWFMLSRLPKKPTDERASG